MRTLAAWRNSPNLWGIKYNRYLMKKNLFNFFLLVVLLGGGFSFVFNNCYAIEGPVRLKLNADYIKKTEAERLFRPTSPYNLFDYLICEATTYHDIVPAETAYLMMEVPGEAAFEITSGRLEPTKNPTIFQWKIPDGSLDWPKPWTSDNSIIERVIEGIKRNGKIFCKVNYNQTELTSYPEEPVTNCVHLWGNLIKRTSGTNGFKIAFVRGASTSFTAPEIVDRGITVYENGFWRIDPFQQQIYRKNFEYYADLLKYNDTPDKMSLRERIDGNRVLFLPPLVYEELKTEENGSSCYGKDFYYLHSDKTYDPEARASTRADSGIMIIWGAKPPFDEYYKKTYIHEFGHNKVCNLNDEYVAFLSRVEKGTNCTNNPSDPNRPCASFLTYGDCFPGCSSAGAFRPSATSLMINNAKAVFKFNVISCGYCLKGLGVSNNMTNNWSKCMGWNTVKPGDIKCIDNNDCLSPYGSEGCGRCNLGGIGQCEFSGVGTDCLWRWGGIVSYGYCLRPDTPDGPFVCDLPFPFGWECNSLGGCKATEKCDLTTHKCVPK